MGDNQELHKPEDKDSPAVEDTAIDSSHHDTTASLFHVFIEKSQEVQVAIQADMLSWKRGEDR